MKFMEFVFKFNSLTGLILRCVSSNFNRGDLNLSAVHFDMTIFCSHTTQTNLYLHYRVRRMLWKIAFPETNGC